MAGTDETVIPAGQTISPEADGAFHRHIKAADEIWAVIGRGGLCFRYGPFRNNEIGPIMERAISEGVGMTIIVQCGKEIDWVHMRELSPATYGDTQGKAS